MLTTKLAYEIREPGIDAMRAVMRSSTSVPKSATPFLFVSRKPLVTDSTTDSVSSTQLRHREAVAECIADELNPLFHR
jgi:hypothetical protein